ncbi:EboA domain-containing protein [Pseudomonas gingeri]|uniref:EboA domain-containing protein n=1 Tax=Pseudomonas gingeri TaxID=117681 RepID=A0A7Y7YFP7_9PSED|nr:EboA domain-containing protein [Pseudomonas gingeri]NWB27860.1 EboA domain-containing protein [Pseudomonas gingeri]NWC35383.1 EboA domain-containing protein [Pseudomonas gingeri]NWD08184.1 EboA domain-containing protein [Pseudomonas gingeri]NWE36614.1 EboA domain-containing protein [Pseudomonas gingeri]NWE57821.1 EboA domain-containing protein [Pseudomonas gingeri]
MNLPITPTPHPALDMRHDTLAELRRRFIEPLDESARQWWQQARDRLARQPDANTVALLSSQYKRGPGQHIPGNSAWTHTQLAHVLLLAQALEHQAEAERLPLLQQLFRWADDQEKIALLKALDWLDSHGSCLGLALQAGRTNNSQVFAAIALDNPYPARHYDERAFHQLILKALGMGLDVRRTEGLAQRRGHTLNQLALDLLEEQLAADRAVSAGLPHVIAFALLSPLQLQRLVKLDRQQRLPPGWREHLPG